MIYKKDEIPSLPNDGEIHHVYAFGDECPIKIIDVESKLT
jgi:hypothetical protein